MNENFQCNLTKPNENKSNEWKWVSTFFYGNACIANEEAQE